MSDQPESLGEHESGQRGLESALISDFGVLGLLQAITKLRGLLLLPIFARRLGVEAYGLWSQSVVVAILGSTIISTQLPTALVRFVSGSDDQREMRAYLFPTLLTVGALGAVASATTLLFPDSLSALFFGDPAFGGIVRILGPWIAAIGLGTVFMEMIRALQRIKLYGILTTARVLAQLAVVGSIILTRSDLELAVMAAFLLEVLVLAALAAVVLPQVGIGWEGLERFRESLRFSGPLIPNYYAGAVLEYADRFMITLSLGVGAVGVYAASYNLAKILNELSKPVLTALMPTASRVFDQGRRRLALDILGNSWRYYLLLAIPGWVGMALLSRAILESLADSQFAAPSVVLVPILGLAFLLKNSQRFVDAQLKLVERTRRLALSKFMAAALHLMALALLLPRMGLPGGAFATLIGFGADYFLSRSFARDFGTIAPAWASLIRAGGASIAMGLVLRLFEPAGVAGMVVSVLVGVASYGVVLGLLGEIRTEDVQIFRDALAFRRTS